MIMAGWSIAALLVLALLMWLAARFVLSGRDLSQLAPPEAEHFAGTASSGAAQAVRARVMALRETTARAPLRRRLAVTRQAWEALLAHQAHDATFVPVHEAGVAGEWVLAPGADPSCRLLYIHGGAYAVGSARSHRSLTTALSCLTGCAVFAVDYRLMPEHRRRASVDDCRSAWRWLLQQGPAGPQGAARLFLAGDSAGGNLALALVAWMRDAGLRAPDAVAVMSPQTDSTLASPSLRTHRHTDLLLGPAFGPLLKLPRTLLLWLLWLQLRINPSHPVVSPVFGDLSGLPPTLVQASATEMMLDDARRYAARARAAGSPVRLQIWDNQVHVWQLFHPDLPEATEALAQISQFFMETPYRRDG